jgi:hypothetical protein
VKTVCTTGTEQAPTLASEGISLDGVGACGVKLEADADKTLSGSGDLLAYLYDDITGRWGRCPGLDLTSVVSGLRQEAFTGFQVISPRGRIAYVPSAVTVSSGGVTIYINATDIHGRWV